MANDTGGCKIDRIARERELDDLDQRLLKRRDAGASLSTSQSWLVETSACCECAYQTVATPHRGGRRLWWWPFEEFVDMVTRAAWTALAARRAVPANRPPDDRFHR